MLPFLKRNQEGSASTPIDTVERKPDNEAEYDVLESAAEDLISAVHSKDIKTTAAALRAAFDLLDSEPHEEGSHFQQGE